MDIILYEGRSQTASKYCLDFMHIPSVAVQGSWSISRSEQALLKLPDRTPIATQIPKLCTSKTLSLTGERQGEVVLAVRLGCYTELIKHSVGFYVGLGSPGRVSDW